MWAVRPEGDQYGLKLRDIDQRRVLVATLTIAFNMVSAAIRTGLSAG